MAPNPTRASLDLRVTAAAAVSRRRPGEHLAHQVCAYSNATRGNVEVKLSVVR